MNIYDLHFTKSEGLAMMERRGAVELVTPTPPWCMPTTYYYPCNAIMQWSRWATLLIT